MTSERTHRPKGPTTALVTTGVVEETPVFSDAICCDILLRAVAQTQQAYGFEVLAYAILPSHFRWIVHLGRGRATVSDVMRDVKTQSALDIMTYLDKGHSYETLNIFARSARKLEDQRRRFWRPHFEETAIGDLETLRSRIEEIHEEPVRAGLAERASAYRYSSAWTPLPGDQILVPVTPVSELEWII